MCQGLGLGWSLDKWQILSINLSPILKGKWKGIREREADLGIGKEN